MYNGWALFWAAQAQIGTNKADAKCTVQETACQSRDRSSQTVFCSFLCVDLPRSERCAGTRRWAGHCRCYSSSLWTSLHPPRQQTSSSSETTHRHTHTPPNIAKYEYIKMQNGRKCQWSGAQRVCARCTDMRVSHLNLRMASPADWRIHHDSSAQNMLILSVRTSSHGWVWLKSWKQ